MLKLRIPPPDIAALKVALQDTFSMKGGDPAKLVNKAAKFVVSFAAATGGNAKVPTADPAKIEATLRHVIKSVAAPKVKIRRNGKLRRVNRASKVQNEWRNTLAAMIVGSILSGKASGRIGKRYKKLVARLSQGKGGGTANAFYRMAEKLMKSKRASAGYLRSGLVPGLQAFRAASSEVSTLKRNFRFLPGTAAPAQNGNSRIVATMEDSAKEISRLAPDAFRKAEREVASLFNKWIIEDLAAAARRQGLTTT